MNKYFKTLELDKILQKLAELTCCETAFQRALRLQPSYDYQTVASEIQKTSDAFLLSVRFGAPSFLKMKDPVDCIKICKAGGVLSASDLLSLAKILKQARLLIDWKHQCDVPTPSLEGYFESLAPHRMIEEKITDAILSESEINDSASDELYHIRKKIKNLQGKVRDQLDHIVRSKGKYLQEQIVTIRDDRFVVPVKAEHRSEIQGLVHDSSASGATLFIEPVSVVEANNEIRVLRAKEEEEIQRILAEFSSMCAGIGNDILTDFDQAIRLNLIFSKARLAEQMKATVPEITNDGVIDLKKARHPLIASDHVVPVDISLGRDYRCLVITGPNTGGKTVTLKTIGLLSLMAMCGFMIPAGENSRLSIFDRILVDIGDEQSIEQSLSTFSAHIKNIISIIQRADDRSLILLDELGSGTDPVEGAALATAVLEYFRRKGSRLAATTHYSELKIYALQTDGVSNACCEFDVNTLKPTYRLLIGVPGRSNAFAISERLGLSKEILQEAEQFISTENKRFEDVVDSLERSRQEYEREQQVFSSQNQELQQRKAELERQKAELEKLRESELQKAREEAKKIVDDVRARSQGLIDELDEIRKSKDREEFRERAVAAKAGLKNKMGKLYDLANPVSERKNNKDYVLPRPLKIGDTVLIFDIDKQGTVLTLPDSSGNVMVQAGIIKTRVSLSNLRLLDKKPVQFTGKTSRTVRSKAERTVKTEIDLRGMTVEEALLDLDLFIDNAVLTGVNVINIIHGKGTGALRAAVQQHLKKHKSIRTFRLGVYGEGESGVTIAELK